MSSGPVTLTAEEAAPQGLADGAAGVALLHIERALTGSGQWSEAHTRVRQVAAGPVDAGAHTGLYYGAPAVAFVLHAAATGGHPAYRAAADTLDEHVLRVTRRRLAEAADRMEHGRAAAFDEYDLFRGLAGIGALLLRRAPGSDTLGDVLRYVVRLVQPRHEDGRELPGWWAGHDPDPIRPTSGGHGNLGMAHGAAGLLALLALATSHGCAVEGQKEAIERLLSWFDGWQQDSADGPWWPEWVTREDLRTGRPTQEVPGRPSWCYGALGIGRAQQLAAIATGDSTRRAAAEKTIVAALSARQLHRITDAGLCHGMAGVYQTAYRAAADAADPAIGQRLPAAATALTRHAAAATGGQAGLLTGDAGVDLALETTRCTTPPRSGWDACLLIT
ncbi:lanthionine synthetase C family protein [Streptosporangium sp. NPDC002524]|uniref:lanthionine synthetase C family protein n=1 Tax=Streptosporangium sp. NPDC002524 TaxID=3154537 RepID=UPI003332F626